MTTKPSRVKFGLNKTDKRLINTRLEQLKIELERQARVALDLDRPRSTITLTRYKNIERRYKIQLTAIHLLLTHLNHSKNEQNITSFRKSSGVAERTICKAENIKRLSSGLRPSMERKRDNRLSVFRPKTEYRYNYVGINWTSSDSSSGRF